jgi:hypothetical protein
MLAFVLPVILLEIVVCLLYVGLETACHSVRDHCLSFFMLAVVLPVILQHTKDKQDL